MKLFYQYVTIFFNLPPTARHFHPLQVENCDSNSRLVVGADDNGKFNPGMVLKLVILNFIREILKSNNLRMTNC